MWLLTVCLTSVAFGRRIARTMLVGGGAHELDMPAGAKITYLTRPFTTRLQHRHEFVGAEAKEDEDALLLGMYGADAIRRTSFLATYS
jgi:hypothetical protein